MIKDVLDSLKEYDQLSLTRLISIALVVLFFIITIYLVFVGVNWANYETFCMFTVGLGTGNQLVNKYINSKYNTLAGQAGKPLNSEKQFTKAETQKK